LQTDQEEERIYWGSLSGVQGFKNPFPLSFLLGVEEEGVAQGQTLPEPSLSLCSSTTTATIDPQSLSAVLQEP
jgi:hypothetical protein